MQLNVPDEVAELREEVADECRKFGTVVYVPTLLLCPVPLSLPFPFYPTPSPISTF